MFVDQCQYARNATGRRCNRFEADLWARTTEVRRNMLCPVLACLPFGVGLFMQRAKPLSEDEVQRLKAADERTPDCCKLFRIMNTCRVRRVARREVPNAKILGLCHRPRHNRVSGWHVLGRTGLISGTHSANEIRKTCDRVDGVFTETGGSYSCSRDCGGELCSVECKSGKCTGNCPKCGQRERRLPVLGRRECR
jgi:hypothetical protein